MKKSCIMAVLSAVLLLTSCVKTPDSVKSNNHKTQDNSEIVKCSPKDAWNEIDEAYSTDYKKFKLPDKKALSAVKYDEIYNAQITYINGDDKWLEEHLPKFEKAIGITVSGDPVPRGQGIDHSDDKYSVYLSSKGIGNVYCSAVEQSENTGSPKKYYLNQVQNLSEEKLNKLVKQAGELSEKADTALESDVKYVPCYVYSYDKGETSVYSQATYKGVGINCVNMHISDDDYESDANGRTVLASQMMNFVRFIGDDMQGFYGQIEYKTVKDEKIDNIISFKTACDILEKELSANAKFEFDDVELWYEPRGQVLVSGDNEQDKNIYLTPKWYFIMNDNTDYSYAAYYVTVDCVSGEIHVLTD